MKPKIEVIDIDDSDIEEPKRPEEFLDSKSEAILLDTAQPIPPTSAELLERRRKFIDQLLSDYIDNHNKLSSLEPLMNPAQKTKWSKHLRTRHMPTGFEPENPEDAETFGFNSQAGIRQDGQSRPVEPMFAIRRRSNPRRVRRRRKAASTKRAPRSRAFGTSSPSTSSRRTYNTDTKPIVKSNISSERKPTKNLLNSILAKVKKEKGT